MQAADTVGLALGAELLLRSRGVAALRLVEALGGDWSVPKRWCVGKSMQRLDRKTVIRWKAARTLYMAVKACLFDEARLGSGLSSVLRYEHSRYSGNKIAFTVDNTKFSHTSFYIQAFL